MCALRAFRQNLGARLLLAMMLVLCVWLLSGCGVESSAELELSQDGAGGLMGSRTISCSVEQDQLSRRFTGGEEALDALLEQACPQELTWEKEAGEGWLTYRFRLDFDSQEAAGPQARGAVCRAGYGFNQRIPPKRRFF